MKNLRFIIVFLSVIFLTACAGGNGEEAEIEAVEARVNFAEQCAIDSLNGGESVELSANLTPEEVKELPRTCQIYLAQEDEAAVRSVLDRLEGITNGLIASYIQEQAEIAAKLETERINAENAMKTSTAEALPEPTATATPEPLPPEATPTLEG